MGFLYDDDRDVPPPNTTHSPTTEEPLAPAYPYDPNEDPIHRAFGHPLGSDPTSPEAVRKAGELVWDHFIDPIGKGISLVTPFIKPIAKSIGPEVLETGEKVGKTLGPIGTAISAGEFLYDCGKLGYDAGTDVKNGVDPYHDQKIYNDMAGVTSNGIHTLLSGGALIPTPASPFLEGADALLTAGELATDLTGKTAGALFGKKAEFSANDVEGGLLRYAEGDRSIGDKANNWVTNQLGGGFLGKTAGTLAGGMVNNNPLGWMWNTTNALIDGANSEVKAAQDGLANGEGLMGWGAKHGLNGMGLPKDNPLLMAIGLGGNKSGGARVSAGMGGGISSALGKPAEGVGGGGKHPHHHPLLAAHRGPAEGVGRGR